MTASAGTRKAIKPKATNNNLDMTTADIDIDINTDKDKKQKSDIVHYKSATFDHLQKYDNFQYLKNLFIPTIVINYLIKLNNLLYDSIDNFFEFHLTPSFLKLYYNKLIKLLMNFDSLFDYLILIEGLNSFQNQLSKKDNKIGLWCIYFFIDYMANFFNIFLKKFIMEPFKLSTNSSSNDSKKKNTEIEMPHLSELSTTTRSIKNDLQLKVNNDYIKPTKVKATKLLEPTLNTYKSVSETYETNLSKENNNIPKALYSTGKDLGNMTLKKFNSLTKESNNDEVEHIKTN